jgi:hypothetical protein
MTNANDDNGLALAYKTMFAGLWNPIAQQYDLQLASPTTM